MPNLLKRGHKTGWSVLSQSWRDRDIAGVGRSSFFMNDESNAHFISFCPSGRSVAGWQRRLPWFSRLLFVISGSSSWQHALLASLEPLRVHIFGGDAVNVLHGET